MYVLFKIVVNSASWFAYCFDKIILHIYIGQIKLIYSSQASKEFNAIKLTVTVLKMCSSEMSRNISSESRK